MTDTRTIDVATMTPVEREEYDLLMRLNTAAALLAIHGVLTDGELAKVQRCVRWRMAKLAKPKGGT